MAKLFNRAKMTTATTGSGTVTLGSASNGFQTFAAAGVSNGDVVQYVIEEGANFEIGTGTYSSTGSSLTRSPTESSNSNNAITLAGQATVSITAVADDLNRLQHGGSDKVTVSSTGASVTGNLAVSGTVDGRDVASDGSKLDGIEAGATGDQTNAEIRAAVEAATDSNVFTDADHSKLNGIEANATADQTITAGGGLTGGGTGNVTISHSDTSSQASVNGSGRTYIQDITLDTYGHVTGLATATETVVNTDTNTTNFNVQANGGTQVNISAGEEINFINGNATTAAVTNQANPTVTFHHNDTSSQASVNNSSGTVIQDVTLDGYGHVTGLASVNLDGRYYTESEADSRFVNVNGDTMTAPLTIDTNTTGMLRLSATNSSPWAIDLQRDDATNSRVYNSGGRWYFEHRPSFVGNTAFDDGYHPNADTLTTARTINGVSFNGSANITVADSTKLPLTGGTLTGNLNLTSGDKLLVGGSFTDNAYNSNSESIINLGGGNDTGNYSIKTTMQNFGGNYTKLDLRWHTGVRMFAMPQYGGFRYYSDNAMSTKLFSIGETDAHVRITNNLIVGGTVDGRDVAADGTKLDTIATNANYITNNNQLTNGAGYTTFTANQSLNTSSNPTFNQIYANDWFRVNGADGIYWQSYAGGWQMTDSSWMRVYNNKGIYTSGEIQGGTINTPSDINLKKDIVKIDDALDKLHQLNGYNFTFKATDKKSSGVIAQEVQKVMPQLVHEGADEGTLTVEYGNMVGLLIEAIKEQQTQIDDLKAEIQSMKS